MNTILKPYIIDIQQIQYHLGYEKCHKLEFYSFLYMQLDKTNAVHIKPLNIASTW